MKRKLDDRVYGGDFITVVEAVPAFFMKLHLGVLLKRKEFFFFFFFFLIFIYMIRAL